MRRRVPHPRYTIRLRLTLIYGGVFLACGAVLVGFTYFLVRQTTKGPVYSVKANGGNVVVKGPHGPVGLGVFRALGPVGTSYEGGPLSSTRVAGSAASAPAVHPDPQRTLLALARCMRAHGVTAFPDPTSTPPSAPPAGGGIAFGGQGSFLAVPQSLIRSPEFKQAATVCSFPGVGHGGPKAAQASAF